MRLWLAALVLVAGCTPKTSFPYLDLVDQRTFQPKLAAPKPADVKNLPALPLVVIRFDVPDPNYTQALANAVDAATSRKPDVEFDVMTPVGAGAQPDANAARDAAAVATAIAEQSVPPERIHVGSVEDAGTPAREVRVYVR